jgi:DNA-binding PadR family transcriptional regulator
MAGSNGAAAKGWMRGPLDSLRGTLLGLVLERPGHVYDLANRLENRLGDTWQINRKDIYRLLAELAEDGLLVLREEREGRSLKMRLVYHPTEVTAPAVTEWIEAFTPKEAMREGIRAKVAVARERDAPALLRALRAYERECLDLSKRVPAATEVPAWGGLVIDCTRDAVDAQLRCELEWVRRTRRRIDEYLTRQR